MCGICGFILNKPSFSHDKLSVRIEQIALRINHRGPDSSGSWTNADTGVALGHRRLAVLDLSSAGHQPMISHGGRYVLVLNGEIYNFAWIKRKLAAENAFLQSFRGHSDTEVFLRAIETYGIVEALQLASGMFALAVWDKENRELIIAGDRIGQKPLYYGFCHEGLVFASELACFKEFGREHWQIDRNALALFFRHNYIPAPHSILKNVYKLEPGHFLKIPLTLVQSGKFEGLIAEPYWQAVKVAREQFACRSYLPVKENADELERLLHKAVSMQMIADVPLGAFLSGGVDSSLVAGVMQSISAKPVKTFTIGFNEQLFNEAASAKLVARHLGTDHTELFVTPEMALAVVPDLCRIYSEPFADSSQIPTYLVSRLAKQQVTVALTGDGGDELFGGYARYFHAGIIWKLLKPFSPQVRQNFSRRLANRKTQRLLARIPGIDHGKNSNRILKAADLLTADTFFKLYKSLVSHTRFPEKMLLTCDGEPRTRLDMFEQLDFQATDLEKIMFVDLLTYLPDDILVKVDRAAMAASLETRLPFLDPDIVDFSFRLPVQNKIYNAHGKIILRHLLDKYVPPQLTSKPKHGFSMPVGAWIKGCLKEWAAPLVNSERLRQEGYLDNDVIQKLWCEHQTGKRNCERMLWNVFMFQSWLEDWKS